MKLRGRRKSSRPVDHAKPRKRSRSKNVVAATARSGSAWQPNVHTNFTVLPVLPVGFATYDDDIDYYIACT